jgi:putative addiction module component (TIGR02574 family)
MSTLTSVTEQAMLLSADERVVLAQRVLDSVEHFTDTDVEKAWMQQADRRWQEIEEGKVKCLPADEVMKAARAKLRR